MVLWGTDAGQWASTAGFSPLQEPFVLAAAWRPAGRPVSSMSRNNRSGAKGWRRACPSRMSIRSMAVRTNPDGYGTLRARISMTSVQVVPLSQDVSPSHLKDCLVISTKRQRLSRPL